MAAIWPPLLFGVLCGEGFGIIGLGVGALDDALKVVGVEEAVSWDYAHDGCIEEGGVGGQPDARIASSRFHSASLRVPSWRTKWPEMVSLGKVARSMRRTRWPLRASSMARDAPAQRAPTIIASYMVLLQVVVCRNVSYWAEAPA